MKRRAAWVVCCLAVVGCGGAHRSGKTPDDESQVPSEASGTDAGDGASSRPDLAKLRAREAPGLPKQAVAGLDKAWKAQVGAVGAPKVTLSEGISVLDAPIGSGSPLHCEFYAEDVDAAGSISGVLGMVGQKVKLQTVEPWDVRVVKDAPTLYVRALYLAETARGKALGELKIALFTGNGHPVVCLHDELGYEKTFLELTSAFFESIERAGTADPAPEYLEVQTGKLGDIPVGFTITRIEREGDTRVLKDSVAMMVPASTTDLRLIDDFSTQTIDSRGMLVKGVWAEGQGGKLQLKMQLERDKGATYKYEGEVQGKPVHGTFKTAGGAGVSTGVSISRSLVKAMKKAGGFAITEQTYHPGTDPTQPLDVKYSRTPSDPAGQVRVGMGKLEFTGHVDPNGLLDQTTMPMGGFTLTLHRELARGKP